MADTTATQVQAAEERFADELAFLAVQDTGPRPPGWAMTPRAVVDFICGVQGLRLDKAAAAKHPDLPARRDISPKFIGDKAIVQRCVVTLAGARALLLTGEPGTAKSMLSELLAAAISGTSAFVVQGSAGTTEDQLRYGWNYAQLLAEGPSPQALVPSAVMAAMRKGTIVRVEEITRMLPEIQDALVPVLSERRISVAELGDETVYAREGFSVIATANLRDKGVSDMSAALKRRFNFERIDPIADRDAERRLVARATRQALDKAAVHVPVDTRVVDTLVTIFRDLRRGITDEGWPVDKPSTTMSTAEAVAISSSLAFDGVYFPSGKDPVADIPGHIAGAVRTNDDKDTARLAAYFDTVVKRRAEQNQSGATGDTADPWTVLWQARTDIVR
ncbi:AAA family ATPase [Corynebacterium mendelii]|uniref:AAA family ATPase n=1 Tax=Corynebacterium mendelii TaxID=2765362 RepID=A0A939DZP4_9CORY|nr:AAA family ATPase [Corynebacterium mendelii]MBN9643188.1 AAA family ATPase [Corynebacterium mendelii]